VALGRKIERNRLTKVALQEAAHEALRSLDETEDDKVHEKVLDGLVVTRVESPDGVVGRTSEGKGGGDGEGEAKQVVRDQGDEAVLSDLPHALFTRPIAQYTHRAAAMRTSGRRSTPVSFSARTTDSERPRSSRVLPACLDTTASTRIAAGWRLISAARVRAPAMRS
jgi:hypothetical protein